MNKKRIWQSGFSLIEIMVALALLGVLSGTMFHAFSSISAVTVNNETKAYGVTRQALEGLPEYVRSSDWNAGTNPLRLGVSNQALGAAVTLDATLFQCFYTVDGGGAMINQNPDALEDYRKVEGVVSW